MDETQKPAKGSKSVVERLVMLPPYIKPEHGEILGRACAALEEYEQMLISRLQELYPASVSSIRCDYSMREIQRAFMGDPLRMEMIKSICTMRLCFEQPRFMVECRTRSVVMGTTPQNLYD